MVVRTRAARAASAASASALGVAEPPRHRRPAPPCHRRPAARLSLRQRPRELVELLDRRQVVQAVQAEVDQELLGRAVEQRAAHDLLLAPGCAPASCREVLQRRRRVLAADRLDLGDRHRLPVGHDGQRLQRGGDSRVRLRWRMNWRTQAPTSGRVASR